MKYLLIAFTALFLLYPSAHGQTIVSGNVTGVWSPSGNPYIVSGNVNVVASLIIKPGVIVRFNGGGWSIRAGASAKFVARGKEDSLITFEALTTQNPGAWDALILENSGGDDTLDYCLIRSAQDGIRVLSGGGFVNGTITNCIVYNSAQSGIRTQSGGEGREGAGEKTLVTIRNCQVYRNLGNGVSALARGASEDSVIIHGCTIDDNVLSGVAVEVVWYWVWNNPVAHAALWNSTIINNLGNGVTSYHQTSTGTASTSVRNSCVVYNHGYGLANVNGGNTSPSNVSYNCLWRNVSAAFQNIAAPGFGQNGNYRNANGDSCDVNFNIYNDPLLVDTTSRNYGLQAPSKAIDAGTPIVAAQYVLDPDSTIPDIGALYFHHVLGVRLISPNHNEVVHADSVQLVWFRSVPAVQRYWLELGTDSIFSTRVVDSTVTDTTKMIRSLADGVRWWRVKAKNSLGWGAFSSQRRFLITTTGISFSENVPSDFGLSQNYPNPFNPETRISFTIPHSSFAILNVFDLLGREVATLVNESLQPGTYEATFEGSRLASGVYFYRLQAGVLVETKKLLILR